MTPRRFISGSVRAACAVGMLVALSACYTTVRQHEEFAGRRTRIARVAVIPPQVDATLIVFTGVNEALPEEAAKISAALPELLKRGLEGRGFSVATPVVEEGMEAELRAMLTQLRQTSAQVNADMYKTVQIRTSEAMKYRASVGPQVSDLASALDADALLLATYSDFHKSSGETAKDVTMSVLIAVATLGNAIVIPPKYAASLQVMLVDGATGEMLWSNVASRAELLESPVDPLVEQIFMPMKVEQAPPIEAKIEPEPAPEPTVGAAPPPAPAEPSGPAERSVEVTVEGAAQPAANDAEKPSDAPAPSVDAAPPAEPGVPVP